MGRWQQYFRRTRRLQQRLKSYGMAGAAAYGLSNTVFYVCAFMLTWLYIARVPRGAAVVQCRSPDGSVQQSHSAGSAGLGWGPAAAKFAEVMATVWAYSQVSLHACLKHSHHKRYSTHNRAACIRSRSWAVQALQWPLRLQWMPSC